jgi:uncharacterized SAM-binding protein YcdF (DUF218 family)
MAVQRERLVLAGFGALLAIVAWFAFGLMTGLGKLDTQVAPLTPIAAVAGASLALSRLRLLLWIGASVTILLCAVVALTPLTTSALPTRALVRRDAVASASLPLDAVVVLSGGITADSLLEPEALDRLLTGLTLMQEGAAPLLVVTRARRRDGGGADGDQQRVRALVARSFPMLLVDSVRTTRDEAVNARRLFQERGVAAPRVAVVTSPLHTRRACAAFETVGFAVTCVPATSRAYSVARATSASDRLALFRRWLYERAAWAEYRRKAWVRA